MNALSKGGLVFKRLRRYSLFGKKKKNPFNVIWYAIRNNRNIVNYQINEILVTQESMAKTIRDIENKLKPAKRGRPRKTTK